MLLTDLLEGVPIVCDAGDLRRPVTGISNDSRSLKPGELFVCIKGFRRDGHDFIPEALRNGAAALVAEKALDSCGYLDGVPWIQVSDTRTALAVMSGHFYGWPSRSLRILGVTGTNGKTTVTHLIHRILAATGREAGLISTVGCVTRDKRLYFRNTTPDSQKLNELLKDMVGEGLPYCVMEVSSHALALSRVHGIEFDVAVFTNIGRDHFEFHRDLAGYVGAKRRLFQMVNSPGSKTGHKYGVVCVDDPMHSMMVGDFRYPVVTFGIRHEADIRGTAITLTKSGGSFEVVYDHMRVPFRTSLPGLHNVYNVLAAIAVGISEGVSVESIVSAIESFHGVSGRWEVYSSPSGFDVIVDFAHNPEGMLQVLKTARRFYDRCITVFGCEGGKDPGKRPLMGKIAAEYSDFVIITSDNPNFEDPRDIMEQIETGLLEAGAERERYQKVEDRCEAIRRAVHMARRGDAVLVLGKGHETFQLKAGVETPHDDRRLVRDLVCPTAVGHTAVSDQTTAFR